jgi:CheY-like chemotaxis protein
VNIASTILLAEDDPIMRRACEVVLRRRGFTVHLAADGEQALQSARTHRPDLILLDLLMPRLTGAEVLRALKDDRETEDIPVLILSNASPGEIQDAVSLGAIGFLVKANLSLQALGDHVTQIIEQADTTRLEQATEEWKAPEQTEHGRDAANG